MSTQFCRHMLAQVVALSGALALLVAGVTAVAAPGAAAAPSTEGPAIRNAGGPNAIPDSYIVVLKGGAPGVKGSPVKDSTVKDSAALLAGRYSATVQHTYSSALRGFSATMSAEQARRVAADPDVAYVEQDTMMSADTVQDNPTWGLDRVDERALPLDTEYNYDTTATNVTAYVIDSGVRPTHTEFLDAAGQTRVRQRVSFVGDKRIGWACNSHGTHVAGTIGGNTYGVAKGVRLVDVRVLGCDNKTPASRTLSGVDWVTANHVKPAVANMSLGSSGNTTIDNAVRRSVNAGVTYVVSAGNDDADACEQSPARVGAALTVGSTTSIDRRSDFSNFGTCVDVFAPGSSILSALGTSTMANGLKSGTSMASPHVAGAAALYLAKSTRARPSEVHAALVNNSTPGKVSDRGDGSPNRLLFRPRGAVVTALVCDSAQSRFFCTVSKSAGAGPLSIRWSRSGTHVPSWNNLTSINGACTAGVSLSIGVTVTDSTADWRTGRSTGFRCHNVAP